MSRSGALTPARGLPAYALAARGSIANGVYNQTPDNNRPFATALANAGAGSGSCHDVFLAGSDMVYDGSAVRSPLSWPEYYRLTLAAQGVASGGTGLLPCADTLGASDSRIARSAGWSVFAGDFLFTSTNGATLTFTPDVAGQLVLTYDNSAGKPAFTVKIGAAGAVTVTPNGTNTIGVYAPAGTVPAGTAVVLTAGNGVTIPYHIGTIGASGYVKHNLARSSMGALTAAPGSNFATATDGAFDPTVTPGTYNTPAAQAYAALSLAGVTASRVTISLLANDLVGGKTPAQIVASLPNIIAKFPGATVRIVVPWQFGLVTNAAWESAAAALYAFADARGCQLLDWRALLGNYAAMQANGVLGADNEHVTAPTWASFGRHVALNDLAAA